MKTCEHPAHDGLDRPEAIVGLGSPGRGVTWLCEEHWIEAMTSLSDWLRSLRAKIAEMN